MRHFFYLVILLSFVSCNYQAENQKGIKETADKFYSFNIGYNTSRINLGSFYKENQLYFFFYNSIYSKYIDIYNKNQIKTDSIFVDNFNSKSNPIVEVNFSTPDTISLRTKHDIIYFINKNGDLLHTLDVNNYFSDKIDTSYQVYPSPTIVSPNKILFVSSYNDLDNPFRNKDFCMYLKYFIKKSFQSKRILLLENIFKDSAIVSQHISNFELNFTDTNHFSLINPYLKICHPHLFIYTSSSDYIFKYSLSDFKLIQKIKLVSRYSQKLHTPPFLMEGNCKDSIKNHGYMGSDGLISDLFYNDHLKRYYVLVRHQQLPDNNEYRHSVICYDKEFKLIGETRPFETPAGGIFWDSEGIFISKSKSDKRFDRNKLQYNYYEFTN